MKPNHPIPVDIPNDLNSVILQGIDAGKKAVEHAHSMNASKEGRYVSGYGIGDYTLFGLTFRGFQAAASFFNVQRPRREASEQ